MRRSPLLAIVLLLALPAAGAHAGAPKTAIFFYPWYSNMRHDGHYSHWTQGGHTPPFDIASAFFPARGPYSSGDPARPARPDEGHRSGRRRRGRELVVGPGLPGGQAAGCRDARRETTKPSRRRSARAVRRPKHRLDRRRPRLHSKSRHSRRLHLPLERLQGGRVDADHSPADGSAPVRADEPRRLCGARRVRRVLSVRHRRLRRGEVRSTLHAGSLVRDPLRAFGRPRVRRRGRDRRHAREGPAERRDLRLDVERSATTPARTSSRSRRTTSGARGRRSSPRATAGGTRATTAPTDFTGAQQTGRTSDAPRTGRHASRNTSAAQPETSPSKTSSTPRSEGWARSTRTSSHSSRPSEPAPSSAPKQRSVSVEMTFRRPV